MSSVIEGYNYDIFISYRQKDNKGDRWVSTFIEGLKTELEATFKEDISIYFDENPHDRLQETHNIDKSLEGKLKCLIFIPILSQTYCDPNSYAWQYEFLPFLRMAENDRFGKDIRLRGGNISSRILPVQIHDLDEDDKKKVENVLGGFLRGIEFIYKEPGVYRPLRFNEENPHDNLNQTIYRNQINKVALAVKEIVSTITQQSITDRKSEGSVVPDKSAPSRLEIQEPAGTSLVISKKKKRTIIISSIIQIAFLAIVSLIVLNNRDSEKRGERHRPSTKSTLQG